VKSFIILGPVGWVMSKGNTSSIKQSKYLYVLVSTLVPYIIPHFLAKKLDRKIGI